MRGEIGGDGSKSELAAAQAGEAEALGRVLQRCRAYLLTVANAELDSNLAVKGGASDLVQESLMEAQKDFAKFGGTTEEELRHWLKRILRNNLIDLARRYREASGRDIRQETSLDREAGQPGQRQLACGRGSPLDDLLAVEKKVALEAGLARLPEVFRRVVEMRHTHGKSFPEIGEALGKSAEAARKLWFRAIRQLREELKGREEFGSSMWVQSGDES